ncbi:MAG: hypothetical protein J7L16_06315 [Deltaproteobacteria bacterium]|nr:hypothetical protein [Deltaproteobacteria bacterium]
MSITQSLGKRAFPDSLPAQGTALTLLFKKAADTVSLMVRVKMSSQNV